jgi:uncharacterized phage protein (TIGR01671 family)
MREIKFRGMSVDGVMRYGQLSQDKPDSTVYYKECSQRICWDDSNIPVTNESLGQFTGLKDKNGKEIYEGDVLMNAYKHIPKDRILWEIKYHNHSFMCYGGKPKGFYRDVLDYPHNLEVIGNIYEKEVTP